MKKEFEFVIPPEYKDDNQYLHNLAAQKLKLTPEEINVVQIIKRSIDARSRNPVFRVKAIVYINEEPLN